MIKYVIKSNNDMKDDIRLRQMMLTLDNSLLEFIAEPLTTKKGKPFSRCQALYDLIIRHKLAYYMDDYPCLTDGFQNLATTWCWNRNAVRKFITALEEKNIVSTFPMENKVLVLLKTYKGSQEFPDEIQKIIQKLSLGDLQAR